jgi:DNA-binding transcriptional regulator YdaS (Cro superfamily)
MDLLTYLAELPADRRETFSSACGSTFARLRQIAYGHEPASPELCVAIDRETEGAVAYDRVNDHWLERKAGTDGRKRIPMDWEYLKRKFATSEQPES